MAFSQNQGITHQDFISLNDMQGDFHGQGRQVSI